MMRLSHRKIWTSAGLCTVLVSAVMATGFTEEASSEAVEQPTNKKKIEINHEYTFTVNDITGPARNNSSLKQGFRHANRIDFSYQDNVAGKWERHFKIGGLFTNDRNIDSQDNNITVLEAKMSDGIRTTQLGDVYANYSDYAMSGGLKGISYEYKGANPNNKMAAVYGISYPRWDNFFRSSQKAIKREVIATHLQQEYSDGVVYGLSVAYSDDKSRVNDSDPLYRTLVSTLDFDYHTNPKRQIKGEISYASGVENSGATGISTHKNGFAAKVTSENEFAHYNSGWEYERVDPSFLTVTGWAAADKERAKVKWSRNLTDSKSLSASLSWYRNQLPGSTLTERTDSWRPEINYRIAKAFHRPNSVLTISPIFDSRMTGVTKTRDYSIAANYQDLWGRLESSTNLQYVQADTQPYISGNRQRQLTYNNTLSITKSITNGTLRYSLATGYWQMNDQANSLIDKRYESSFGVEISDSTQKFRHSFTVGQNHLMKDGVTDDSYQWFLRANLSWNVPIFKKAHKSEVFVNAFVNDYRFETVDSNYRETGVAVGVKTKF